MFELYEKMITKVTFLAHGRSWMSDRLQTILFETRNCWLQKKRFESHWFTRRNDHIFSNTSTHELP